MTQTKHGLKYSKLNKKYLLALIIIFSLILTFFSISIILKKNENQKIIQVDDVKFNGVNLIPFKDYEVGYFKYESFLGGSWYIISLDSSKLENPKLIAEKKYIENGWEKGVLVNSRGSWTFPLEKPYVDNENDVLFITEDINEPFGVTVRVAHRKKTDDLFFYITIPK